MVYPPMSRVCISLKLDDDDDDDDEAVSMTIACMQLLQTLVWWDAGA